MYLIIGASSFIGRHLYDYCTGNGIEVFGTYFTHSFNEKWIKFDLCSSDLEGICHKHFSGKILDAVIICGADSSIDHCKSNEMASNQLNVKGTKRVLEQADRMGIKSVFLSSEAVFDGTKGMYGEEDIPNPVTLYGRQKLQIEQYIIENIKEYLIFRISRATGSRYGENDIFNEFYHKIVHHEEIVCLKNQSFCVTEVDDIAKIIVKALENKANGLYHISSGNYISRYDLAMLYSKKVFGRYERISEKEYKDIPFLDNRHIYGGLCGEKLGNLLGFRYMDLDAILDKYVQTIPNKRYLILGASGYIGSYVYEHLEKDAQKVLGTTHSAQKNDNLFYFDILKDSICDVIKEINEQEKIAIVCIGESNIGHCYESYDHAYKINVIKTKELIHALCQSGFYVIFFSTDNVFDGKEGNYTENSKTCGINKYGMMKEEMEHYLLENEPDVCIFRLSKVVDIKPVKQNILFEWENQAVRGQIDCIRGNKLSFVAMEDVYQACLIAEQMKLHGLYNIVGDKAYDRAELADKFCRKIGKMSVEIKECDIQEISLMDNRPLDISMSNLKFKQRTGYRFMSMDDLIEQYIENRKGWMETEIHRW